MDIADLISTSEKTKSLYHALPKSFKEDIVDETYHIHTDRPIDELNTQFCRYYFATHMESEKEYFAIILNNNFRAPIEELSRLKSVHCPAINSLLAFSLVKLGVSKKYSLCAIVEPYNPADNLQNYIGKHGTMNSEQIETQIMPALTTALSYLDSHKMNCSNICPSNILIDKNGNVKLREFFVSPPNFHQDMGYLSPEIADANPFGRRVFGISSDIYALGASMFFALTGSAFNFSPHEPKLYNAYRIEAGTYESEVAKKRIAARSKIMLAWTLQDNPDTRWSINELIEWLQDKRDFTLPRHKAKNNYATLFAGHNYANPRALASAMFNLYEEGTKFCRSELFLKWMQKTKGKTDSIEDYVHMYVQNQTVRGMSHQEMEESFFLILKQLSPQSPLIRLQDFCISIASIPDILFEAFNREDGEWTHYLLNMFSSNFFGMLESEFQYMEVPQEYIEKAYSISNLYKRNIENSAIENTIYKLDKYVPCQSNVVASEYVLSIEDLLISLDKIATHTPNKLQIDDQIIAFIESRININNSTEQNANKIINSSQLLKGASYLAKAQEEVPEMKIPNLSSVIAQKLIEWINENIYNSKLKNVITSELAELAGSGVLSQMIYVVSNPQLFQNDMRGYKSACRDLKSLENKIKKLSDPNETYLAGIALGQRATVLIGYLLCMIVALVLMM